MECRTIFEERNENIHNVVWLYQHMVHIATINDKYEMLVPDASFDSTSKLKIYFRNDPRDTFRYELVFNILTNISDIKNTTFSIYYFDDMDDMILLYIICMHLNRYYNQNLTLEHIGEHYILKNGQEIVLQSFF
ncbi:uncharacterized protein VICG_00103 [Vittaforma corneae ATCC 50505]|uniref:Uncharacterized protein n=1 Tax=Vittaforma corneae (strain ATCC 50505) TaxID=993615 RepID=L2GPH0_VITCO|nr:uncharacterized protein VICG_00103 [Vittaforma corneae ATCC 50505]ELA42788.1 hypothetical protein VICG_00103 [Vittaforma corneae ATCC 50505]